MPRFFENVSERVKKEHATKIAAYIWQNSSQERVDRKQTHAPGDIARGQELFASRGCLGCHTISEGGETIGDGFAADLSRIGEKDDYDYVVEWVMNPDSGVMPNLRLTPEEARDVASYLVSKTTGRRYDPAPQLSDPELAKDGLKLIRHYGCAGCHEIAGLENEGRIGTELTNEGSKPKERLDFGRWEHQYKRAGLYTHKAFFETKLSNPGKFGIGKVYEDEVDQLDRLKMPNFHLGESDITALTTMLMGSVETEIPESFHYAPTDHRAAIREGWWVVRKYNCVGCHQVEPGVEPGLWSLAQYVGQDEEGKKRSDYRPPSLVGIGFRTNPDWLGHFLRNPAQVDEDDPRYHGNGVRPYLAVRMPTFRFSEREIQKLVAFFGALDAQPEPHVPEELEPLTPEELTMARDFFKGVKCVNCHATGDPVRDAKMNAPYLTVSSAKLKPAWTRRWLLEPLKMLPGTSMPQNFLREYEVRLTDGRTLVGTDLAISRGRATLKLSDGTIERFEARTIADTHVRRTVGTLVPESMKNYEGDYVDLITRYLLIHYDEEEIPNSMPED